MKNERISAAEIRALGCPVPDRIPDCATISRQVFQLALLRAISNAQYTFKNGAIKMDMQISLSEPFEWVDISFCATVREEAEITRSAP